MRLLRLRSDLAVRAPRRCGAPLLLLALLACRGADAPDDAPKGAEDSGAGEVSLDGAGGDGGEGDDSALPGVDPGPTLQVVVSEPVGAAMAGALVRVALIPLDFGAGDGGPRLGGPIAEGAVVDGVATLELPLSLEADALDGLARAHPAVQGALFGLVAYAPTAEGGSFAEGQPLLGLTLDHLVLFRAPGEAPEGWPEAWSVVDTGMAGMYAPNRCLYDTTEPLLWREAEGYPRFSLVTDPVPLLLRGREAGLDVEVTMGLLPDAPDHYALVPHQLAVDPEAGLAPVVDLPLAEAGSPLRFSLRAAPEESHDLTADPDWRHTLAYGVPYADADGSGGWSGADPAPRAGTCADRSSVAFRYTRPVSTWRGLRLLDCYSGQVGWRLVRWDEAVGNEVYLPAEAALALRSEDGCSL
ncbi:MAG: hypothetical protein JNM72_16455 [Deltaproteobacteria bacterium]|nr:hypothetical protein [Deltaproteobacteria bacterium]